MHEQSAANDRIVYERIGRFIYSFHRVCGSIEALNETALAANAPRELQERAANLAQKFSHILKKSAFASDEELRTTLVEASEVQSEIARWRSKG